MSNDLTSSVIRIVQDYCFQNNASIYVSEFSLAIAPRVSALIESSDISCQQFIAIAKQRRDFFVANNIDPRPFCTALYRALKYEIRFCCFTTFKESILDFKRKMENGLSKAKGFSTRDEDTLRNALALYIRDENFLEAKTSSGRSDIIVPAKKAIIETKVWNGQQYYDDGLPELEAYLQAMNYHEGHYVVFDYNKSDNPIVNRCGEVFDIDYNKLSFHVYFIRMNKIAPSQIGKERRKRATTSGQ